jgi:hypothetical protein
MNDARQSVGVCVCVCAAMEDVMMGGTLADKKLGLLMMLRSTEAIFSVDISLCRNDSVFTRSV